MFLLICLSSVSTVSLQAADTVTPLVKTIRVGDIDIAYQDLGSGDPLVMIMGYGGSMDLWSPRLLQLLTASHRVLVFDNRGMGRTTSSDAEYSISQFAQDTLGLMDSLCIDEAIVLGWSMGAEIAQEVAILHPERVRRLILISGGPGGKEQIRAGPRDHAAAGRHFRKFPGAGITHHQAAGSPKLAEWSSVHLDLVSNQRHNEPAGTDPSAIARHHGVGRVLLATASNSITHLDHHGG